MTAEIQISSNSSGDFNGAVDVAADGGPLRSIPQHGVPACSAEESVGGRRVFSPKTSTSGFERNRGGGAYYIPVSELIVPQAVEEIVEQVRCVVAQTVDGGGKIAEWVQQCTLEQTVDDPMPLVVEELVEAFQKKRISQSASSNRSSIEVPAPFP